MEEKENNKIINKKVFENIIIAVILMILFIVINYLYGKVNEEQLKLMMKIVSSVFMGLTIVIFEVAYRKDSGKLAISGIESLVLSCFTLSITYVITVNDFDFNLYILVASYTVAIYYVMKAILIYTKEKKKFLDSLSDIREIVDNKPQKKKATKKKKQEKL